MRITVFVLLVLLAFSKVPNSEGSDEFVIWSQGEPSTVSPGRPQFYEYSYTADELKSKAPWLVGKDKFPLELGVESKRAQAFIEAEIAKETDIQQFTNEISLQTVRIMRVFIPQQTKARKLNTENTTNEWFVVFMFTVGPRVECRCVVSLLDGIYAREKSAEVPKHFLPISGELMGKSIPKEYLDSPKFDAEPDFKPYAEVDRADFELPSVQWEPQTQSFPLNFDSVISKSRMYLADSRGGEAEGFALREIYLQQFIPEHAVEKMGLHLADNFNHWLVTFKFNDQLGILYDVYMLLDQRIIGCNKLLPPSKPD